ncbi:MAG: hypothetical protein GY745_13700 [Actinomycetia bacterium]|nr:hypothetical protein [Actinomycetes bacterium]MCP4086091.1 hypothetical protein [Actinomycetes bacterium]
MSFIGSGPQDWPELDLEEVELESLARVVGLVEQYRRVLTEELGGPFEVVAVAPNRLELIVDGEPVMRAQSTRDGRLIVARLGTGGLL